MSARILSAVVDADDARDARYVVVPTRPGPLRPVATGPARGEIDDVLDDLFGEPDDRGPGVTDGVLLAAGTAAVVGGAVASVPLLIAGGVGAVALGGILPSRELWRRLRRRADEDASGLPRTRDGIPLRVDGPAGELAEAHARVFAGSTRVTDVSARAEIESAAHGAAYEVASLLAGKRPGDVAEREYVRTRTAALRDLAGALADVEGTDVDAVARRARVEARREIEDHAGSSLDELSHLADELRDGRSA